VKHNHSSLSLKHTHTLSHTHTTHTHRYTLICTRAHNTLMKKHNLSVFLLPVKRVAGSILRLARSARAARAGARARAAPLQFYLSGNFSLPSLTHSTLEQAQLFPCTNCFCLLKKRCLIRC